MMKQTKRLLSLALAVLMVLTVTPLAVVAEATTDVAKIGQTTYATLSAAMGAAQNGDTVQLLTDVVMEGGTSNGAFEIAAGKKITLDLNGHSITAGGRTDRPGRTQYVFDNYADLTIKGTGTITSRGIQNYGKLTIENGVTVIAGDSTGSTAGGACVWNYDGAELVINGGTFKVEGEGYYKTGSTNPWSTGAACIHGQGTFTVAINGGTFTSAAKGVYAINLYGDATISNATVEAVHGAVSIHNGTLTVNGGSFTCDGVESQSDHCVYVGTGGNLICNGGTFTDNDGDAGGKAVHTTEGSATINNGTFTGKISNTSDVVIYDGTFDTDVSANLAPGLKQDENGQVVVKPNVVAIIGTTEYGAIADALANAVSGDTVQLLTDVVMESGTSNGAFEITAGRKIALDLNGHSITAGGRTDRPGRTQYVFDNYADLTIKGTGTITSRGIQNYGKLTIENGVTVIAGDSTGSTAGGACVWNYDGAELIINGGTFKVEGEGYYKSGSSNPWSTGAACIHGQGTFTVAINGGTFTSAAKGVYAINIYGDATISNATVEAVHGAVSIHNGTLTVNGGSFTCDGVESQSDHCVYVGTGGNLICNGGTFTDNDGDAGGKAVHTTEGSATINNGTFTGKISNTSDVVIYDGTFDTDVSANLAPGLKQDENGQVVVKPNVVAIIGTTEYGAIADALANAVSGDTIKVLGNLTIDDVILRKSGVTLDLNGYTLTADFVWTIKGSHIVDNSAEKTGVLVVSKDLITLDPDNAQLAVWNGVNGYVFTTVTFTTNGIERGAAQTENSFKFWMAPQVQSNVLNLLATEDAAALDLTFTVQLSWTSNGAPVSQQFTFKDETVKQVYTGIAAGENQGLYVTVTGVANIDCQINGVITSAAGTVITGATVYEETMP